MIRVLVVDDDAFVRAGLRDLVATDDGLELAGEAAEGAAAVAAARSRRVDVALVDIRMPGMDGIAATAALSRLPDPPAVIVLTTFDLDEYVYGALAAGAAGFLLKDTPPDAILQAIHVVAAGAAMLSPTVTRTVISRFHHPEAARSQAAREAAARLTPRERQVLSAVADGMTNAEIGAMLGLRESTVKAHVSRILAELGVTNRVQAALAARDLAGRGG
ncbi:response regulator transcription factor [Streptomyces sp. NBC_01808]|uniref:response regulator transcription factor n=1 Tax=Streptomyces sp. NBC_01808 TaxID=2975947 RepID=UPI002DD98A93|nr:response regulator transcription factor [Streptomyces sp. NBC_01808]WSA40546.1 response regulator transcription factor [Streptomyces sp. NBC_01808]